MESIGYLEVEGLSGAIVAADRMLKTAQVQLKFLENTKGNGWITVSVTGDVAAVEAAIDAGKGEMGDRVAGSMVIANPAPGISELGKNDAIKSKFDAATEYDDSNDDGPDDDGPDGGPAANGGPKDNGPKDGGSNGGEHPSSTTKKTSGTDSSKKAEAKPEVKAAPKPAEKIDSKPATTTKAATPKSTGSKPAAKPASQASRTKRPNTRRTSRKQTKK